MKSRYTLAAKAGSKGFTLIELMIVMVIVGVLSAIAMPAYTNYGVKVRMADMRRYIEVLTMDQEAYYKENGRFYGQNAVEKTQVDVGGASDRGFDKYHHWTQISKASRIVIIEIHITEDLYPDAVAGSRFIYEGVADDFGHVSWECVQHKSASLRLDEEYLPDDCTDIFTIV